MLAILSEEIVKDLLVADGERLRHRLCSVSGLRLGGHVEQHLAGAKIARGALVRYLRRCGIELADAPLAAVLIGRNGLVHCSHDGFADGLRLPGPAVAIATLPGRKAP